MIEFSTIEKNAHNVLSFEAFFDLIKNYKNNLKDKAENKLQEILNESDRSKESMLQHDLHKIIKMHNDIRDGKLIFYINDRDHVLKYEDKFLLTIYLFIGNNTSGKHNGIPIETFHVILDKNDYSKFKMLYDV